MVSTAKDTLAFPLLRRVVIENVQPEIEAGRFAIKRVIGERVEVTADIHADGHDILFAVLQHRSPSQSDWQEVAMQPLVNDRWTAEFKVSEQGRYFYTVCAWVDPFKSWWRDLRKKFEAGQDVGLDLLVGVALIEDAAARAHGNDREQLLHRASELKERGGGREFSCTKRRRCADRLDATLRRPASRNHLRTRTRGGGRPGEGSFQHMVRTISPLLCRRAGQTRDVSRLREEAALHRRHGVRRPLFSSIHPIGRINRKGKNNSEQATPDDVGSPWAIGAEEGGHDTILPQLGTIEDFKSLQARAKDFGLELALDLAFQCTPDHPYVKAHKEWFRVRPDGSVQIAENPPKRYQDIYPIYFESDHADELCEELKRVVLYWIARGFACSGSTIRIPKPFEFWEWLISGIKSEYPDVLFLAEAFTRPKVMYRLAKLGFTRSALLRLAQYEMGVNRILFRVDADRGPRILPAQLVAEHSRYPHRVSAVWRPPRVHDSRCPCRHTWCKLRNLWSRLRALREPHASARQVRRVSRLGEVPASALGRQ